MPDKEGLFRIKPTADNRRGGWRVALFRLGRTFSASFAESMYDSPALACQAAECFLLELQKLLPPPHTFHRVKEDGLPGSVKFVNDRWPHWRAMLSINNKRRKKQYTIAKYGNEEAFQLAQETRRRWLRDAGYFRRPELPTDEEIDQISQQIRSRFNERDLPRLNGERYSVDEYGLMRPYPYRYGKANLDGLRSRS